MQMISWQQLLIHIISTLVLQKPYKDQYRNLSISKKFIISNGITL